MHCPAFPCSALLVLLYVSANASIHLKFGRKRLLSAVEEYCAIFYFVAVVFLRQTYTRTNRAIVFNVCDASKQ